MFESDVFRRQILTTKFDPRTVRVKDSVTTILLNPFSPGLDLRRIRRLIPISKVDRHTERVQIFIRAVDPLHRYSNEAASAIRDIYNDIKLRKPPWSLGLYNNMCFNP